MGEWMSEMGEGEGRGGRAAVVGAFFQVHELTIDGPSEGLPSTPLPLMSIM